MIRVAILGGGIGAQHLDAYRALPEWDVALLVDQDATRRSTFNVPTSDSIDDALASDVNVIDICLPPALHRPVAVQALEAGKHVICEKPLAPSLRDVDAIIDAATRANRTVFPVFQYRYGPAMDALRALDAAGLLGRPKAATLETHWARHARYYAEAPWRGTWAGEMGGCLITHAIHAHDLLDCLMGPITKVTARTATLINPIETEDSAAIVLELASGALATSSVTLGAAQDESRVRLVWEHLTATSSTLPYAPMTGAWQFTVRDPTRQPKIDTILAQIPPKPNGFSGFLTDVAAALNGQTNSAVTLLEGRRSIELATALYASARAASSVALPLPIDHPLYDGWQP
ncbi:Gfo/Idh/MocA family protein [Primorskyibacter sp. S187A]|uniref:Gfo/Idh/MocA family protein n=1 Tax=Primorskyibacter sp. S187A TaxID=3415130 RepID=UPI003C7A4409